MAVDPSGVFNMFGSIFGLILCLPVLGFLAMMVFGAVVLIRVLRGSASSNARATEESLRIEELHALHERLFERLESLETILLNKTKEG